MPPSYIVDMDGVIYHGHRLIPGVLDFLERLRRGGHKFLFLTNNSQWTPRDLSHRLSQIGIDVDESSFHTSALATADFLHRQKPGGTAYVIGGAGLTHALYSVGYTLTEHKPDYVVVGDTRSYDFEKIERASRLVAGGARFVATNLDLTGPSEQGIQPACGALVAPIELVTGRKPYFVGKPNPLMMRTALRKLDAHSADSFMVGDRMDTDILAGTEAGMRTILVLSGVSSRETVEQYPFRPTFIFENVGEIPVESLT
ncbi:HAD-IIA family hydrolase [Singulisphaera acidiphila]|uniref:Ribonucleotide monophosphatase NagD n=1 Tax=Singulisphaera acidiphila (strain ATCC BAA-1392 / DSM 18658 / VKM B-2454 / MOB10) TaxID=886293 RepID=L0DCT7_SINAD|nr:HAD-IIA family hydrolase [Singulisphaera acidiphila]AGA26685.1 putative sugar phosphatase of HAD superfamily [Singulisphaera acidiphila DSM 18658]